MSFGVGNKTSIASTRGPKHEDSQIAKRFQEIVKYEAHIYLHRVLDTETGECSRFYDMENDETDRLHREQNLRKEKMFPDQMPKEGSVNVIKEWD